MPKPLPTMKPTGSGYGSMQAVMTAHAKAGTFKAPAKKTKGR